jgi:hypothetical protein
MDKSKAPLDTARTDEINVKTNKDNYYADIAKEGCVLLLCCTLPEREMENVKNAREAAADLA